MIMAGGELVFGSAALQAVGLLTFQQSQLAPEVGEGPEIVGHVEEQDGQQRHDDDDGGAGLPARGA